MTEERKSELPALRMAIGLFLLAVCIGTAYFALRNRAANHARLVGLEMDRATIAQKNEAAKSSNAQIERKVAHAKILRSKWQVWAQQHQNILKRMLQSQPSNQVALNTVWNALPAFGDKSIISPRDLNPDGNSPNGLSFGWASVDRMMETTGIQTVKDPAERERIQAANFRLASARKQDFERMRDIKLASSFGQGNTLVTLWVSGRITETVPQTQEERMEALKKHRASDRSSPIGILEGEPKEIVPPFDFLK